jgi:mono/diheme cytochrome c family protein
MVHKLKVGLAAVSAFLCGLCLCNQVFAQALPDGKGKAEFVHNCTACHRADMVTRVKKTPDDWRKSVDEMAARGTDGTKQDLDNVVLYLDTYFALNEADPADAKQPNPPSSNPAGHAKLSPSDINHVKRYLHALPCP